MPLLGTLLIVLAALSWPRRRVRGDSDASSHRRGVAASAPVDASAHAVAEALLLTAVVLRSGCAPVEALSRVAEVSPAPVAGALRIVVAGHRWGMDARSAWSQVDPVWSPAAAAWAAAEQAGVSPGPLLEAAAASLQVDADTRAEAAIARAGVLLVLPLGLAFLPGFLLTTIVPVVSGLVPLVMPR